MPFPKPEERKKCWATKDAYWQCLTDNNNDKSKCLQERQEYENSCIKQWVVHFDRIKNLEIYKEKFETNEEPPPEYGRKEQ